MKGVSNALKRALGLTVALLVMACGPRFESEESCQFVQNSYGQRVSWNGQLPVKFYIHSSVPEKFHGAIRGAMAEWDQALGSRPLFEVAGTISHGSKSVKDGANVIYMLSQWDTENGSEQARTSMFWKGTQIQEADIQLNGESFDFFTGESAIQGEIDLESLMVHEFGHALGLTHSSIQKSVMASRLASATLRREPTKDDMDSLRCEY